MQPSTSQTMKLGKHADSAELVFGESCCIGGLHLTHRLALPGFIRRKAAKPLMRPEFVVALREAIERCLQYLGGGESKPTQRAFQSTKQPLDAPVAPVLARRPASMHDAQRLQGGAPQLRGEHRLVVSTQGQRQPMLTDGHQQVPEDDERALAGQALQAQQLARSGVDDAEHGECRAEGRGDERQVQCPRVAGRDQAGLSSFALAAQFFDLDPVLAHLAHEHPYPGLADRELAAVPAPRNARDGRSPAGAARLQRRSG